MHILILAGGFATRLWPLTECIAKPLIPVASKPLISYMVEQIPDVFSITISTNRVFADAFEHWKSTCFPHKNIEIFIEDSQGESEKKGALAAVALYIQKKNIQTDMVLLAGDNYFGFCMNRFLQKASNNPLVAVYDIQDKESAKKFGVVVPKNEIFIDSFEEKPENPSSTLVSTGAYFFPATSLSYILEYSQSHADDLGGVFEYFLEKSIPVQYFSFQEEWYDIGSFSAFMQANKALSKHSRIHPSVVQKNVQIEGICIIEKNVFLENVTLIDTIILEECIIKNSTLKECLICEKSILENTDMNNKMIRSNTISLREDVSSTAKQEQQILP